MRTPDHDARSARAAVPPQPHRRPAGRLSQRLVWLTVAAVLIAEALFVLPSLAHARRDWLERHLRAGQIAALSAGIGTVQNGIRTDLLDLAGIDAVTLQEPGRTLRLARPGVAPDGAIRIDLPGESVPAALAGVVGGVVGRAATRCSTCAGRACWRDGGSVTVLLRRQRSTISSPASRCASGSSRWPWRARSGCCSMPR